MKRPVTEEVILCFLAIHKALQLFGPILEVDLSGHSLEDCNTHGSIALNGVVEDVGAKKKKYSRTVWSLATSIFSSLQSSV